MKSCCIEPSVYSLQHALSVTNVPGVAMACMDKSIPVLAPNAIPFRTRIVANRVDDSVWQIEIGTRYKIDEDPESRRGDAT